jgi:hypothetical protein
VAWRGRGRPRGASHELEGRDTKAHDLARLEGNRTDVVRYSRGRSASDHAAGRTRTLRDDSRLRARSGESSRGVRRSLPSLAPWRPGGAGRSSDGARDPRTELSRVTAPGRAERGRSGRPYGRHRGPLAGGCRGAVRSFEPD